MHGRRHGAIESVLRMTDADHAKDRILRAQFWLSPASLPSPRRGEVIALDRRRDRSR